MTVVTWQVSVGTDDTSIIGTASFFPSNAGLRVGESSGNQEISSSGRMVTDQIQQGATINSAELILIGEDDNNGPNATYDIALELAIDPVAPTSNSDFLSRVRTVASVQVANATTSPGTEYRYDITSVLQEVVDQAGFSEDDAIQVFLDGDTALTGNNDFCQYHSPESNASLAMSMEVDFTNPVGGGTVALSGAAVGGASVAGSLSRIRELSGAAAGVASLTGTLRRIRRLSADLNGSTSTDATLRRIRELNGSLNAGAEVTANLYRRRRLIANLDSGASAAGELSRIRELSAAITAAANLAGTLQRTRELSAQVSGAASVGATLGVTGKVNLSGTAFGGALSSAQLKRIRTIAGNASAGATVVGSLALGGLVSLAAEINGSSEAAGVLAVRKALAGMGLGGGVISGELGARRQLNAAIMAGASVSGNLAKMVDYIPTFRIIATGFNTNRLKASGQLSYRLAAPGNQRVRIN